MGFIIEMLRAAIGGILFFRVQEYSLWQSWGPQSVILRAAQIQHCNNYIRGSHPIQALFSWTILLLRLIMPFTSQDPHKYSCQQNKINSSKIQVTILQKNLEQNAQIIDKSNIIQQTKQISNNLDDKLPFQKVLQFISYLLKFHYLYTEPIDLLSFVLKMINSKIDGIKLKVSFPTYKISS